MYDVVIIGAGVSGSAIARELSRYKASVCVIEKEEDVCAGTSKANSGIAHAGFDAEPGTLKAKLNVEGSRMLEELSKELDFPYQKIGSLVVCTNPETKERLSALLEQGEKNGVAGLRILEQEELREMEPNISEKAVAALYAPTGGIVCPFGLNIAMAENACVNGAEFKLDTVVRSIKRDNGIYHIKTDKGTFMARLVINAAGVHADEIHNMVSENKMKITARKGEYYLLDKSAGNHVSHTIFSLPGKMGKGVLVTPTVHGNLLVGPTAMDIENKEGINTTAEGLAQAAEKSSVTVKNIPMYSVITSFAGLRAHGMEEDFIIRESEDNFIDCAGIESPGLTASPAIGKMVASMVQKKLSLEKKTDFISRRTGILNPALLSMEERNALIRKNPAYGMIVCRCEGISEGEILDAIHRPLGAHSLDGVKRRTRAGMGRCQSGFCSPRTMEILARELPGGNMKNVTKHGSGSELITGIDKEFL